MTRHTSLISLAFVLAATGCAEPERRKSDPNPPGTPAGTGDAVGGDFDPGAGDSNTGDFAGGDLAGDDNWRPMISCNDVVALGDYAGTFDGTLEGGGQMLPVDGTVNMSITCANDKILVAGNLDGQGCVQGCSPFTAEIKGEYNHLTDTLEAEIQNGEVDMTQWTGFAFIIPFTGTMEGTYANDNIAGTWEGTGVDPFLMLTIAGNGSWTADRQ